LHNRSLFVCIGDFYTDFFTRDYRAFGDVEDSAEELDRDQLEFEFEWRERRYRRWWVFLLFLFFLLCPSFDFKLHVLHDFYSCSLHVVSCLFVACFSCPAFTSFSSIKRGLPDGDSDNSDAEFDPEAFRQKFKDIWEEFFAARTDHANGKEWIFGCGRKWREWTYFIEWQGGESETCASQADCSASSAKVRKCGPGAKEWISEKCCVEGVSLVCLADFCCAAFRLPVLFEF